MITVPIHGDFYPGNLIISPGGVVRVLIDWDEARIDWRAWDLANTLLEFCARPAGRDLDRERALKLLSDYGSAGACLNLIERDALPTLVRARKLDELMYSLRETADGAVEDWDYIRASVAGWRQVQGLTHI